MSFKRNFVKSMLVSGGYSYVSQAITFFSSVIVSRFLGPESYGLVGIISIFIGFLAIFSDSGISLAVIRTPYKYTFYKSVDNLSVLIGLGLCLATCILAYPIALYFKNLKLFVPMLVMSSLFVLRSTTIVRNALLAKEMKFATAGQIALITNVINVVLTIVLACMGAGYWSLIVPQIVSVVYNYFALERKVKLGFGIYSWPYIITSYRFIKKTIGNLMGFNLINYWARNSDNFLVGRFYGTGDLGIYNRAYNLLTMPLNLITGLIGSVLYPSLNKLQQTGDQINGEYFFILKMITFISYPVSFILILFPHQLVMLLWGKAWITVAQLLPYFGLLVFSQSLLSTSGNILVLVKKEEVLRNSGWVGAVVMIAGIAYGAFFSMIDIARYYALVFIMIVLPFNMIYIYIHALKFEAKKMILFWCPIIIASLAIWLGCYYHLMMLKAGSLAALFLFIVLTSWPELKKIYKSKLAVSHA